MAMSRFEQALIKELQGIKKELHELNRKKSEQGKIDGLEVKLDEQTLSNAISKTLNGATLVRGGITSKPLSRWDDSL